MERTETFVMVEPLDMFEKLVWEHAQMRNAYGRSRREQAYLAVNAAMTAWHLTDWICAACETEHFKRLSKHLKELHMKLDKEIDNCTVFRRYVRGLPMLAMCEAISVAGKHFVFDRDRLRVSTHFQTLPNGLDVPIVEDGESSVPSPTMISIAIRFWAEVLFGTGLASEDQIGERMGRVERGA